MGTRLDADECATSPTRQRILEAAIEVAMRDGIRAATLEAVARQAGISKGGLIHHFRTKDELIAAMLEHFPAQVLRSLEERMTADPNPRGRFFRALVRTVFPSAASDTPAERVSETFRFLLPVLAASANNNPELLKPFRQTLHQVRQRLVAEGANGMRQAALWPAIFGLMLWQHLGVIAPDDPVRQSMIAEWLSLAEGDSSLPAAPTSFTEPRPAVCEQVHGGRI